QASARASPAGSTFGAARARRTKVLSRVDGSTEGLAARVGTPSLLTGRASSAPARADACFIGALARRALEMFRRASVVVPPPKCPRACTPGKREVILAG